MALNFFVRRQGRLAVREKLHEAGVPALRAIRLSLLLSEEDAEYAINKAASNLGVAVPSVLFAKDDEKEDDDDESIKDVVIAWCKSEEGKKFRAEVLKIIMSILMGIM